MLFYAVIVGIKGDSIKIQYQLNTKKLFLTFYIILAFSLYILNYLKLDSITANFIKSISLIFLVMGFMSKDIIINFFDKFFIFVIAVLLIMFMLYSNKYLINDLMFMNFSIFLIPFIFMKSINSYNEIFFTYRILAYLLSFQVWIDIILTRVLNIPTLWAAGSVVGGMGNPSSFAFACNFTLIFLFFIKNSMSKFLFSACVVSLIIGVLLSNALFMIIMLGFIFFTLILKIQNLFGKIIVAFSVIGMSTFGIIYNISRVGLLSDKLRALMELLGLMENISNSDSVDVRIMIYKDALNFLKTSNLNYIFGHYKNTNYFDVDSQYLTYFFSFGLIGLTLFLILLVVMLLKGLNANKEFKYFITISLMFFYLTFFNNRILDYFPIGYLFFSVAALLSISERKVFNKI